MAQTVSRRRFLFLSLAIAAVPLAQACAPQAPTPTQPAKPPEGAKPAPTSGPAATTATQPTPGAKPAVQATAKPAEAIKRGGTVVQAINWTYPTMDPHLTTIHYNVGYEAMYNGLVRFELVDPKTWEHKVVGDLAESWEQPDAKTVVFHLKKGVTFHDGSDFDATVAAWNFDRARTHAKSQKKDQLAIVESAEPLDKYTLRVRLKAPYVGFLRSSAFVTGGQLRMASKAAMEKLGEEGFARNPSGTGPFKFKQWITDDRLILEKNPNYFENGADGKPLPYLDGFVGRYVPDPTVSLVDLKAGAVHILEWLPTKDVATVKADPNLALFEMPWAGQVYFMGGFNTEAPPFNDVKVRQAAIYGIDREGMAKALGFGVGVPHYYPDWAPGSLGYDDTIVKYEYNPAKVKQYLQEAGKPNGIETSMLIISREPERTIGEMVAQMWTANGIRTKLEALERLTWIDRMRSKNFEFGFWRQSQPMPESSFNDNFLKSKAQGNWSQFEDPKVDQLLDAARATYDEQRRHELYKEVLTYIQEQAYLTTGYMTPTTKAYRKNVKGLTVQYFFTDARRAWIDQ